jgi:hypothetical protein
MRTGTHRFAVILAAGAMALATLPVSAQTVGSDTFGCTTPPEDSLHLDVSNPGPGDKVPVGDIVIHGLAYDRSTTADESVDRVSLFLGARGAGGTHLADATLNLPNPMAVPDGPHQMAGWMATISTPSTPGPADLVVYAHSAASDSESTVTVPMMVAQSSNPSAQCSSSTTAAMTIPATSIHLELSNPQPSDSVLVGGLVVQGLAFDEAARIGPGVDRVTFFLDNRDQGGQFLAETIPVDPLVEPGVKHGFYSTTLSMPDLVGGHNLFVYAHSSVSGLDTSLSVPITIKR